MNYHSLSSRTCIYLRSVQFLSDIEIGVITQNADRIISLANNCTYVNAIGTVGNVRLKRSIFSSDEAAPLHR